MNREKRTIVYFGNFSECVQGICARNDLVMVVFEKGKENPQIAEYCTKNAISCHAVASIKDFHSLIEGIGDVDLFVVGSFGLIFPEDIFLKPKFGTINVHPGYLPFYRGRHPLPWAVYNEENEAGVAVHVMSKAIDRGAIIERDAIKIDYDRTYKYAEQELLKIIPNLLDKSIQKVFSGENGYIEQSGDEGSYFPPMNIKTMKAIMRAGTLKEIKRLI